MSKNVGASPLNLSLSGLQLNKTAAANSKQQSSAQQQNSVRKPPVYTNRSIASSSNNIGHHNDHKKTEEPISARASRHAHNLNLSSARSSSSERRVPKIPAYLKKFEEKENKKNNNEAPAFTLLSVRSSTDEFDNSRKIEDLKSKTKKKTNGGLDLFFGSESKDLESSYLNKFTNEFKENGGSEADFELINPVKEESLNKLQASVDNLRKAFQKEIAQDGSGRDELNMNEIYQNLQRTRRKYSAIKIQRWYRKHRDDQIDHNQAEMEKLFSQKRNEMLKKKMEEQNVLRSSVFNKKSTSLYKPRGQSSSITKNSTNKPSQQTNGPDNQRASIFMDSLNVKNDVKETNTKQSPRNQMADSNATVETLLFNLEKIDKESEDLLNFDYKTAVNGMAANSVTSEKLNSILSFLDDAAADESNKFTPKDFTELKYDLDAFKRQLEQERNEKQAAQAAQLTTPRKNVLQKRPPTATNDKSEKDDKRVGSARKTTTPAPEPKVKKVTDEVSDESSDYSAQAELTNALLTVKMELEEKKRTIGMLEKALNQQRELTIRHTQEADKEMQIRLEAQKADYEATIQRHLNFIDQLIDDKKVLSEKCEKLVKELKDAEKAYSDRLRLAEDRYKVDSQRIKDTLEAAEKLRREKWIEEKTKQIKEMTVKGLEPEIQSLITKHKNELKKLKTIHDAELLQADERAAQRYIKITEELRENYEREKESSIQKERDLCKQRYEKSLEEEEKSFLEQRRRLYAEVEEEKNRVAEQAALQRKELDRLRKMLEENNFTAIETIRKEYADAQAELEKKHQNEIRNLKEQLDIEKQSWEQNYLKKQENWAIQKERELKDQLKRERDKDIEALISRLESEATLAREEADRTAENRVKRIRDKYESELKEVEKTERETMERYNSLKAKYNELEGDHERMKVIVRQREKDLDGIKKLTDVLQEERNRLADVIRQEFSDRIVFTEEENKKIKLEMAEIKSRHLYELDKKKEDLEKLQKEKTDELNTVHEKVKQVVAKKDEAFNQLKQQYEAACKRADHLEGLLEQQRTLVLKKQSKD